MSTSPVDILLHKALSAPSFGRFWKGMIGFTYWCDLYFQILGHVFKKRLLYSAKVEIKRIFRGPEGIHRHKVIVENLGNPRICISNPKVGDTRIFFTDSIKRSDQKIAKKYSKVPHFHLRSSLLRLTLGNLKALWRLQNQNKKGAITKGKKNCITFFLFCIIIKRSQKEFLAQV